MTALLTMVALLGSGLTAGVLVSTVLGIMPLMATFPPDRYVVSHKYLWSRYDPFMPISFGLSVAAGVALAVLAPGGMARVLFVVAAVLLAVVMVISITKQVPINRWVKALDPDALPEDWDSVDPRALWRGWNLARTALACVGFGVNIAAVAALM